MAPDDFDEKLTAIHRDLHTIVMAAERAGEALHAARVGQQITEAATAEDIGALYAKHVACCWGSDLNDLARQRAYALRMSGDAMTPQVPF